MINILKTSKQQRITALNDLPAGDYIVFRNGSYQYLFTKRIIFSDDCFSFKQSDKGYNAENFIDVLEDNDILFSLSEIKYVMLK